MSSNLKDVKNRIKSVTNIGKVTNAMYLIAAAKMKKSKSNNAKANEYQSRLLNILNEISSDPSIDNPYFKRNQSDKVLFVVYSTKRGLCGGLPTNILKKYLELKGKYSNNKIDVMIVGKKISNKIKNDTKVNVIASYEDFVDDINSSNIDEVLNLIKSRYDSEKYNSVQLIYPFANTSFSQIVENFELLPFDINISNVTDVGNSDNTSNAISYKIEPDPTTLLKTVVQMYLQSSIYNAFLQTVTAEYSARMLAMKNASDNAQDIKNNLVQEFNKTRQAQITKELAEITAAL